MVQNDLIFPVHGDADFGQKLMGLKEFQVFAVPPLQPIKNAAEFEQHVDQACGGFEKAIYQNLMQHFISRRSPLRSLLLYHFLGVGKSCSAITIAEAFLIDHTENEEPPIIVVSPYALRKNFEEELFASARFLASDDKFIGNQCTGDIYRKMVHGIGNKNDAQTKQLIVKRIQQLIKSRYTFVTYDGLKELAKKPITDKVIIIDEAHNLRQNDVAKASAEALKSILMNGKRNRLVLLSATPMYNEPDEIFWMLMLMLMNDGRHAEASKLESLRLFSSAKGKGDKGDKGEKGESEPNMKAFKKLRQLSSEYISYIKGNNPFTFPARLKPNGLQVVSDKWAINIRDSIVTSEAGSAQQISLVNDAKHNAGDGMGDVATEYDTSTASTTGTASTGSSSLVNVATNKKTESSVVKIQLSNITYPGGKTGKSGFFEVFSRVDDAKPLQVAYRSDAAKKNLLMPVPTKLGTVATKIQSICDIIKSAEGIVVIYSQFVWSGIVPCAVALEHMGFKRYGARNIMKQTDLVTTQLTYPRKLDTIPSYCIFSGDDNVMGNTRIEDILPIINRANNMYGDVIKVILMTPIAGEGLSFKNVREMHVLEPWYHMNRIEQVIGRAIRTCSHKALPQEERNVTVYLHACIRDTPGSSGNASSGNASSGEGDSMSTPDIHAYKISARKLYETLRAEEAIRDNAIDCGLLKNVNYYPRDLFELAVTMRTSQQQIVPYQYGDVESVQPKCTNVVDVSIGSSDARTLRPGIFSTLENTIQVRLAKVIKNIIHNKIHYITIDELVKQLKATDDTLALRVITKSIYPNTLVPGMKLYPHMNGIVIVPEPKPVHATVVNIPRTKPNQEKPDAPKDAENNADACNTANILDILVASTKGIDTIVATYIAYTTIDSECWRPFARYLIRSQLDGNGNGNGSADVEKIATIFGNIYSGALIAAHEIPNVRMPAKFKYIGYVDIFETKDFRVSIMKQTEDGDISFRDATAAEISSIKKKRVYAEKPGKPQNFVGILEPTHFKKQPSEPYRNQFKIIGIAGTDPKVAASTKGAACNTKKRSEIDEYIHSLGVNTNATQIKEQLCFTLAIELFKRGRLFIYPEWKPKI